MYDFIQAVVLQAIIARMSGMKTYPCEGHVHVAI